MPSEDADLVKRCLRGDEVAVRALVDRFQAEVFGLCLRLLHHRHDAEDVCQEVFLRVFRSLRRWDAARPLKPWIMGIAVNRCRTWFVQRAKRPEAVDYLQETASSPPASDVAELQREIDRVLGEMRVEYRAVFVLFHERGQPYDELAIAMGRPLGTIKTWLHRARLQVLQHLINRGMISPEQAQAFEGKPTGLETKR